jgi:beta-hydroxyacyl-ACP dehydratase FabZ
MSDPRQDDIVAETSERLRASEPPAFDIEQIRQILPHRYPFLLIDRIIEFDPGRRCVGLKNVTINEKYFNGHFPGHAIMPGAILVESIAQVGCILLLTKPEGKGQLAYFGAIDKVRFNKPVFPGNTVIIEAETIAYRRGIGKVHGTARVNGEVVCEGEFTCALVDKEKAG